MRYVTSHQAVLHLTSSSVFSHKAGECSTDDLSGCTATKFTVNEINVTAILDSNAKTRTMPNTRQTEQLGTIGGQWQKLGLANRKISSSACGWGKAERTTNCPGCHPSMRDLRTSISLGEQAYHPTLLQFTLASTINANVEQHLRRFLSTNSSLSARLDSISWA